MDELEQTQVGVVTLQPVQNGYEASYKGSKASDKTPEGAVYELLQALSKLVWKEAEPEKTPQKTR